MHRTQGSRLLIPIVPDDSTLALQQLGGRRRICYKRSSHACCKLQRLLPPQLRSGIGTGRSLHISTLYASLGVHWF